MVSATGPQKHKPGKIRPLSLPSFLASLSLTLSLNMFAITPTTACSRVLWSSSENGQTTLVGRTMDWVTPLPSNLWVLARGTKRTGLTGTNTLQWTSKYASVAAFVGATADGMNEKGLAGHFLWLAEADFGRPDQRPSLAVSQWLQYSLDNFTSVKEAVDFFNKDSFHMAPCMFDNEPATIHLALEDSSGDSAIIEYLNGKPVIHHSCNYKVMTNSPPYSEQLKLLNNYDVFGGQQTLPGGTRARDRFARAAYYLSALPKPKDYRMALAEINSILNNVAQPYSKPDKLHPESNYTCWSTICDLSKGIYYFESSLNPDPVWVKFDELNLNNKNKYLNLNLDKNKSVHGNISKKFKPAKEFTPLVPIELGN
jgi:choloylglycine hydrolase